MTSWTKRSTSRWASTAVVIGSVAAVLASPLAIGTSSAATPATVTGLAVTASNNAPSGAAATANVSGTYTSAGGTDAPTNIEYAVTASTGGDTAAALAGTACTATAPTNNAGTFTCAVKNASGTAATDRVEVFADNGDNKYSQPGDLAATGSNPATVIFSGTPDSIHVTGPAAATAGTCQTYTVNATSGGQPAAGQTLNLVVSETTTTNPGTNPFKFYTADCNTLIANAGTVSGTGPYTITFTHPLTVASDGTASFGLATTTAGSGSVTASFNATTSGQVPVTWGTGGADSVTTLTPTPASTTQFTSTTASFAVKAADTGGNAVQGVTVNEETDPSATNADSVAITSCGTTNSSGIATCTVHNGGTAGSDSLIFFVNNDTGTTHTPGPDAGEPQVKATATFNAQPAVSSAKSTLTCVQQLATAKGSALTNCTVPTTQTSATYTATVEDASGNPLANVPVTFTTSAAKIGGTTLTGASLPAVGTATTGTNGVATFSVSDPTPVTGDSATVNATVGATTVGSATVNWATPKATAISVVPALQSVTEGGTVTVKAGVTDQFGTAVASTPAFTYFVIGRNNAKTGSAGADGTITYTDAGTSAAIKTDTIQVTDTTDNFTGTAKVDYVTGSTTASSVVVDTSGTGSDTTCGVSTDVAKTGVAFGATSPVCAIVKNATGETLAGKAVTFTVSNGQVDAHGGLTTASTKTYTATTDDAGVAFADVTTTTTGAQTVTATADTATGSATVTATGPTSAQAYSIAVTPATSTITPGSTQKFVATVTDKFGNPVPNVVVIATQSGTGVLAAGGNQLITAADGTASVTVSTASTDTGTGSVAFSIGSALTLPANQCATTGGVCTATATYTVATGVAPAALKLTPSTGVKVGGTETVHAVATNSDGTPAANQVVRFVVKGANAGATGSATTDAAGDATLTYPAAHHGTDTFAAFVDVNDDGLPQSTDPGADATVHIKGIERPTISVVSKSKTKHHGTVTVHVVSRPLAAGALVHYFVKRSGSWVKIGSNHAGHLGKAGKSFTEVKGKHLTFRGKVMTTPITTTGTSSPRAVTVR